MSIVHHSLTYCADKMIEKVNTSENLIQFVSFSLFELKIVAGRGQTKNSIAFNIIYFVKLHSMHTQTHAVFSKALTSLYNNCIKFRDGLRQKGIHGRKTFFNRHSSVVAFFPPNPIE